jgi:hypothetical protein
MSKSQKPTTLRQTALFLFERAEFIRSLVEWGGLAKPALATMMALIAIVTSIGQQIPFAALMAFTVLTFGGTMMLFNEIDAWRERSSVEFKLVFLTAVINCQASRELFEATKRANYQPGALLKNTGTKNLWYHVEHIFAAIDDQTVMRPVFESRGGMIAPGHQTTYHFASIPNVDASKPPLVGMLEYVIKYGPSRRHLPHVLREKWSFRLSWKTPNEHGPPSQVKVTRIDDDAGDGS